MNKVYVDKARLLRRVIIISWISLALCFVIKIFGGNFFEIMSDNPNYKALCEYAESHLWFENTLAFISSFICQVFYLLAILQKYKFTLKEFLITIIALVSSVCLRDFSIIFGYIFDFILFFGLPIFMLGKNYKKYYQVFIAFIINIFFQFISLIVKNLSIGYISESVFIVLIYGIDVYIMCFLYYLYRNFQKENSNMGKFWGLFMGKPVDKLKEMKVKREQQIEKLNEEIKAIEEAIKAQSEK